MDEIYPSPRISVIEQEIPEPKKSLVGGKSNVVINIITVYYTPRTQMTHILEDLTYIMEGIWKVNPPKKGQLGSRYLYIYIFMIYICMNIFVVLCWKRAIRQASDDALQEKLQQEATTIFLSRERLPCIFGPRQLSNGNKTLTWHSMKYWLVQVRGCLFHGLWKHFIYLGSIMPYIQQRSRR